MEAIDFNKGNGLVPAIIQDSQTSRVLMMGYMNETAVAHTQKTGRVTFFSRSRNRLWTKGEESGNFLNVKEMKLDCDRDTLLVKAIPEGPVCHTGQDTCWGETNKGDGAFVQALEDLIASRQEVARSGAASDSYVVSLFRKGINKIAQKVGEEAVETVIEAKDDDDSLFLNEASDLLFHLLILLQAKGFRMRDIIGILEERHQQRR
jgi:phosphoribosyl-ATP pyrophosphohydrolase/phosphoribosyl-AMP cyclohydrolase